MGEDYRILLYNQVYREAFYRYPFVEFCRLYPILWRVRCLLHAHKDIYVCTVITHLQHFILEERTDFDNLDPDGVYAALILGKLSRA